MEPSNGTEKTPGLFWPFVVLLILVLLQSLVATELSLYSRNTLLQHPEWKVGKRYMARGLMGSKAAGKTRNILAQNKLHLSVWHGFHEVYLEQLVKPEKLSCRVQLQSGGVLTVLYAADSEKAEGLRLSRREGIPNAYLVRDRTGRFLTKTALPDLQLGGGGHALVLSFRDQGVGVELDGQPYTTLPVSPNEAKVVGFSGQAEDVSVDDVKIWENGRLVVDEDFRNKASQSLLPPIALASLGLALLFVTGFRLKGMPARRAMLKTIVLSFSLFGVLLLMSVFDYVLWSRLYPYQGFTPWGHRAQVSSVEMLRRGVFAWTASYDRVPEVASDNKLEKLLGFEIVEDEGEGVRVTSKERRPYEHFKDSNLEEFRDKGSSLRILMIGTSQTWGAGAVDLDNVLQVQLYKLLSQSTDQDVQIFNASQSGSKAAPLLKRFKQFADQVQPDIILINLSNNDKHKLESLAESLQEFVAMSKKSGAKILLIQEPNSPECGEGIEKGHAVLVSVADEHNLPVVELHKELVELDDTGRLWQDVVHLTSYGQQLAAERMAQGILSMLGDN